MDEIAAVLEVSPATVDRAARTPAFQEAYERGRAKCRYTLRRMQVELAKSGNATMQIWLGKQILGQRDNVHVQQESVVQLQQGSASAGEILRERLDALADRLKSSSFHATGITTYLQNSGKLEVAQQMAGHESARTTGLYDRRQKKITRNIVERISI